MDDITTSPEKTETPGAVPPSEERLQGFLDQVLLRIFSASPGLASYIESTRIVPSDGSIELSLFKIPEEVVAAVVQAFGLHDIEVLRYTKQDKACIGFRARPGKDDLSALAIDDADDHRDTPDDEGGFEQDTRVKTADELLPAAG